MFSLGVYLDHVLNSNLIGERVKRARPLSGLKNENWRYMWATLRKPDISLDV